MHITNRKLLKVANLYSLAIAEKNGWYVITEGDLYGVLKNIKNVMMTPGSYRLSLPTGDAPRQPWGPTIVFNYTYSSPKLADESFAGPGKGDPRIIQLVENTLKNNLQSPISEYIQSIVTVYNGDHFYEVTLTQKPQ